MQRALWPNGWETHYHEKHGTVADFLRAHPQRFLQRLDDQAFYRPDPAIVFGSAPLELPPPGKRLMTPEERTIAPSATLLSRLQAPRPAVFGGRPPQPPPVSEPPQQPPVSEPMQPLVVTPVLPEALALNGGALPGTAGGTLAEP